MFYRAFHQNSCEQRQNTTRFRLGKRLCGFLIRILICTWTLQLLWLLYQSLWELIEIETGTRMTDASTGVVEDRTLIDLLMVSSVMLNVECVTDDSEQIFHVLSVWFHGF